jgi:hypothetical protein
VQLLLALTERVLTLDAVLGDRLSCLSSPTGS